MDIQLTLHDGHQWNTQNPHLNMDASTIFAPGVDKNAHRRNVQFSKLPT